MKGLFMDGKEFKAEKPWKNETEHLTECLIAFITLEKKDNTKKVNAMVTEIHEICDEYEVERIMLIPFAHLSNNLLNHKDARKLLNEMEDILRDKFHLLVSEFGAEKGLMMELNIGPNNVKFRSI